MYNFFCMYNDQNEYITLHSIKIQVMSKSVSIYNLVTYYVVKLAFNLFGQLTNSYYLYISIVIIWIIGSCS